MDTDPKEEAESEVGEPGPPGLRAETPNEHRYIRTNSTRARGQGTKSRADPEFLLLSSREFANSSRSCWRDFRPETPSFIHSFHPSIHPAYQTHRVRSRS